MIQFQLTEVLKKVEREVDRQLEMGKSMHQEDGMWLSIAVSYLGKAAHWVFHGVSVSSEDLVKVAAILVSWMIQKDNA